MSKQIVNSIKLLIQLNAEEEKALLKILEVKQFKKKEIIQAEGTISNEFIFIKSGCLRVFYNVDGIEKTVKFLVENKWYTDYVSFTSNKPSQKNIQALEDSVVITFKKYSLYKLYAHFPVFEKLGRLIAEDIVISISQINKMLTSEKPEQRYLNFIKHQPELTERIPQHYIASYLGIKPQSLSRIKRRIFEKNK